MICLRRFVPVSIFFFILSVIPAHAATSNIYKFNDKTTTSSKKKKPAVYPLFPKVTKVDNKFRVDWTVKTDHRIAVLDYRPMTPPVTIVPPSGSTSTPTVGVTIRAQSTCITPYYLPPNRFEWWDKTPPPTGEFVSDFNCEFSSMLATVSGTDTSSDSNQELIQKGWRVAAWTAADEGKLTNEVAGLPFRARTATSRPVIRVYNPQNLAIAPVVIVNEVDPAVISGLPADQLRPSLWLDFQKPQRAVGLEYGYQILNNNNSDHIDKRGVELIAYDAAGTEIVRAHGRADVGGLTDDRRLAPTRLDHPIGVRDAKGRIKTVELRFTFDRADQEPPNQGNHILEAQVVSRVWTEALPPAAVYQSEVGVETAAASTGPTYAWSADTFQERFGHETGPMNVQLPYRFDRALVFLRGFRVEFLDSQPHVVQEIRTSISQNETRFNLIETGSGASVGYMPRWVRVMPQLDLDSGERPQPPFRAVAYYGILAWDSQQMDVKMAAGSDSASSIDSFLGHSLFASDVCCGELTGTLQNVTFRSFAPVELEEFSYYPGLENIPNTLSRVGGHIAWSLASTFTRDPDNVSYFRNSLGTVLTGAGVHHGPDDFPGRDNSTSNTFQSAVSYVLDPTGPRTARDDFKYGVDFVRNRLHMSWPVLGDMAFVSLHHYLFSLHEEPIQHLDFEVKGDFYDGKVIDWKMGAGVNTLPIIVGESRERFVFGVPAFAAVRRVDNVSETP